MNVLYALRQWPVPADTGPKINMAELLGYMSVRHSCTVLVLGDTEGSLQGDARLRSSFPSLTIVPQSHFANGWERRYHQMAAILHGEPVFGRWGRLLVRQSHLLDLVRDGAFDVIHLDGFAFATSLATLRTFRPPAVLSVIDPTSRVFHQATENYTGPRSTYYRLARTWARRLEQQTLPMASAVHVVSEVEANYLQTVCPDARIRSIPISVSSSILTMVGSGGDPKYDIMLSCNFAYKSLRDGAFQFLNNVLPQLSAELPHLRVLVVGRHPNSSLRRAMDRYPAVTYESWSDNLFLDMMRSKVVVFPDLTGTGVKNRVVSAMGVGRPVVGTRKALEGIMCSPGVDCFLYDTSAECVNAVSALLRDDDLRSDVSVRGRDLITREHSIESNGPQWERLYRECVL